MSLKATLEQAARDKAAREAGKTVLRPYVAPKHAAWMQLPEKDQAWTPAALQRGMEVLSDAHKVKRDERFSASGLGQCPRRQVFSYAGMPQDPPSPESADIMRSGTAAHFWIMMEGLSAGWLTEAETFYRDDHWRVGGTLDGVMDDASIWEYKSVASTVFAKVVPSGKTFAANDTQGEAKHDHLLQLAAYELLTGMTLKSLFYQERNYGAYHEYRLGEDEVVKGQLLQLLDRLNSHVDDNTLPPQYESCQQQTGNLYKECPFRTVCPVAKKPFS